MKHFPLFVILLTIAVSNTNGQSSQKCNCEAIIDIEFKENVALYDKPNGKVVKIMQHDFQKENMLTLTIDHDSLNFFHVKLSNSLTPESSAIGWIKKTNAIGTYARNYQQDDRLFLYSKPQLNSKIESLIPNWTNQIYIITKCVGKWAHVRIKYRGQLRQGWLQPDKQCPNPYTTCN